MAWRDLLAHARFIVGALALMFVVAAAAPASAQQSATRRLGQSDRERGEGRAAAQGSCGRISGRVHAFPTRSPARSSSRPAATGAQFHQVTLRWIGAIAILGMLALLVLFYLMRGMVRIESGRSGRTIVRFNAFERFVHWMTATCFIVLALSGLNITFGKALLLPLHRARRLRRPGRSGRNTRTTTSASRSPSASC